MKTRFLYPLILFFCLIINSSSAQVINTIAGIGTGGYNGDGIAATSAMLWAPHTTATDLAGNVYIADQGSNRVRKINTLGIITTYAGNGGSGFTGDGGLAINAEIQGAADITFDAAGNLYIASNFRIRKVDVSGIVTTIAGNGMSAYGGDGGLAINASLHQPMSIAVDAAGNLYIGEYHNRIRKVNTAGIITTIAGNGTAGYNGDGGLATSALITLPTAIAIDGSGNIFFSEHTGHRIRKINTAGIITTIAGNGIAGYNGDGIAATTALINYPYGIDCDNSGNIFFADQVNNRVRKINNSGIISTVAGNGTNGFSGDGGLAVNAQIGGIAGMCVNSIGDIYFPDLGHRVRKVTCAPIGVISGLVSVCDGSTVNYSVPFVSGLSYAWTLPTGWSGTSATNNINVITTAASGNISVVAINSCGSSAPQTLSITGHPRPVGVMSGSVTICPGQTAYITVSFPNGTPPYTFSYSDGLTTNIITTGNNTYNIAVTPTNTSSYSLTALSDAYCTALPQDMSGTAVVTVSTISATISLSGLLTVCGNQPFTLSANTGTGLSYQWQLNGVDILNANNSTYPVTTNGSYTVIVDDGTCEATSLATQVTFQPDPVVTASSNSPLCAGSTLNLQANTITGATYTWTGPNSFNSSDEDPSVGNVQISDAGTYTVTATVGVCTSLPVTTLVNVLNIPAQPGGISGNIAVCESASELYSITSVPGASSYTWSLPGGWTGTSNANSINAVVGITGGIVAVSASNICGTSTAQTLVVNVTGTGFASISAGGPVVFCEGESVQLDANTGTGFTYQWKLNGTDVSGAVNASYTATASGVYSVSIDNGNCIITSNSITVTVNPLPTPIINQAGNILTVAGTYISYQWNLNGTPISGANSPSYTVTQSGDYTITVTDGNGCEGVSNQITAAPVSVLITKKGRLEIAVIPNPNNGSFVLSANLAQNEQLVMVGIIDITGRRIYEEAITTSNGKLNAQITMSDLAQGVYILKVVSDCCSYTTSFIKK